MGTKNKTMKIYYLDGFRGCIQYIKSLTNVVLISKQIEYINYNYEKVEVYYYETKLS